MGDCGDCGAMCYGRSHMSKNSWECDYWMSERCPYCGGRLSEARFHNGVRVWYCYGCHFDFTEERLKELAGELQRSAE